MIERGPARSAARGVDVVCFDVGETLIDETRQWGHWADVLELPRFTFFAALGGVIDRGRPHREVFALLRPGFDLSAAPQPPTPTAADLYSDVGPALAELRQAGYRLAVAANQPAGVAAAIRELGLDLDLVATSTEWGIEKPSSAFFTRLVDEIASVPQRVAYVGDRVDFDVRPAAAAGLRPIFLRRGPWAFLLCPSGVPEGALAAIDSLTELPAVLARLAGPSGGDRA